MTQPAENQPPVLNRKLERAKGIEPSSSAWEADALPLCYARALDAVIVAVPPAKSSQSW
jgi:hypothetical protein